MRGMTGTATESSSLPKSRRTPLVLNGRLRIRLDFSGKPLVAWAASKLASQYDQHGAPGGWASSTGRQEIVNSLRTNIDQQLQLTNHWCLFSLSIMKARSSLNVCFGPLLELASRIVVNSTGLRVFHHCTTAYHVGASSEPSPRIVGAAQATWMITILQELRFHLQSRSQQ
jgi:hypothetical protein